MASSSTTMKRKVKEKSMKLTQIQVCKELNYKLYPEVT